MYPGQWCVGRDRVHSMQIVVFVSTGGRLLCSRRTTPRIPRTTTNWCTLQCPYRSALACSSTSIRRIDCVDDMVWVLLLSSLCPLKLHPRLTGRAFLAIDAAYEFFQIRHMMTRRVLVACFLTVGIRAQTTSRSRYQQVYVATFLQVRIRIRFRSSAPTGAYIQRGQSYAIALT